MTLNRLIDDKNRGSITAKPDISTIKKSSGAKRARKPNKSILAGAAAGDAEMSANEFLLRRPRHAARHHQHQNFLARFVACDLARHATLTHGDDSIADHQDLRKLRGDGNHCDSRSRQFEQQTVNLNL